MEDWKAKAIGFLLQMAGPTFFALIGRMAHYAHMGKAPSIKKVFAEGIIVIFMGIVSGSVGQMMGLKEGVMLWGFISSMSFFGPKIIHIVLTRILDKMDLTFDFSEIDQEEHIPQANKKPSLRAYKGDKE